MFLARMGKCWAPREKKNGGLARCSASASCIYMPRTLCLLYRQPKGMVLAKPSHRANSRIPAGRRCEIFSMGCLRQYRSVRGLIVDHPDSAIPAVRQRRNGMLTAIDSLLVSGGTMTVHGPAGRRCDDVFKRVLDEIVIGHGTTLMDADRFPTAEDGLIIAFDKSFEKCSLGVVAAAIGMMLFAADHRQGDLNPATTARTFRWDIAGNLRI